jgi:hypothetical protein
MAEMHVLTVYSYEVATSNIYGLLVVILSPDTGHPRTATGSMPSLIFVELAFFL